MNWYKVLLVGFGGALGSIARYVTARLVDEKWQSFFPYGTLAVNVVGSFVLGFIYGYSLRKSDPENLILLLGTGFCGGFTTYSSFAFQNVSLWQQKLEWVAIAYVGVTLIAGFIAVIAGLLAGKYLG